MRITAPAGPRNVENLETPWGQPQCMEQVADGVWQVSTAGHGGLYLAPGVWRALPERVRKTMLDSGFAEEDCEAVIAAALLDIGNEIFGFNPDKTINMAIATANRFERYAPALPYLKAIEADQAKNSNQYCAKGEEQTQ